MISLPYVVRLTRAFWRQGLALTASMMLGPVVIGLVLGYISTGTDAQNGGFGVYSADASFLVSPHGWSRLLPDLDYFPRTSEGFGFVGLGVLLSVVIAVAIRWRRRGHADTPEAPRSVWVSAGVLALFATWPAIHAFGQNVFDVSGTALDLSTIGDIFRTNGRFVWTLCWLVATWSALMILSLPGRATVAVVVAIGLAVQIADTTAPAPRRSSAVAYQDASAALAAAEWARSVQIQPPTVIYSCSGTMSLADLAPLLLAAAVHELPVNSGYPARASNDFATRICVDEAQRFRDGDFEPDVLYVIPAESEAPSSLACTTVTAQLAGCRFVDG